MTHFASMVPHRGSSRPQAASRAFTLVELLVSMTVLTILLLIVTNVISETQKAWSQASSRVSQFREARAAFDVLTRNISQATLNTYWDYKRSNPNDIAEVPSKYERTSELSFIVGQGSALLRNSSNSQNVSSHAIFFQAPLGNTQEGENANLTNLLCARGYYVLYGNDAPFLPGFLPANYAKNRFRLMEYSPTAETNRIYADGFRPTDSNNSSVWFERDAMAPISATETAANRSPARPIAENIIALIISPRVSPKEAGSVDPTYIAPFYDYDSTKRANQSAQSPDGQGTQHLIPPLLEVTMVALDGPSAEKLELQTHSPNFVSEAGAAFTNANSYQGDIQALEDELIKRRLNFRVFRATIPMRSSKWSL
ncbi:Verru_Chthon cassette protein C [Roseimicrobium sp. ORNL1]|uniref:Verru_Chthon cassette protein C n=1 Tax=Roseimicrobium sp. ORNL1 TaxID=2711231 RepID=UPI0013E1AE67|nr:Verru_Chthon cassette protein C [Roseimicrobium sp. ORNL1]QIF01013.1 Verru_Chthon cassette protein C [Roseimicrobium sp. ORNL1]